MNKADASVSIHDAVQRHAAQLQEIHLLAISLRDNVSGIRQPNKGDVFMGPVPSEGIHIIGSDRKDLRAATGKFRVAHAQARQLRAAVRSQESAQECQHNGFVPAKTRETNMITTHVVQFKIRREFTRCDEAGVHFGLRRILMGRGAMRFLLLIDQRPGFLPNSVEHFNGQFSG